MTREKIPDDVVAVATAVAGADPSPIDTLAPMRGGASGALLFTMVMNGATFVARKPGTFGGPIDREKLDRALDCMRIASELGVAPELIHADQATGITVVRKIEGTPVTRGTPRDTDPLGMLARTLRTLHAGPAIPYRPGPIANSRRCSSSRAAPYSARADDRCGGRGPRRRADRAVSSRSQPDESDHDARAGLT